MPTSEELAQKLPEQDRLWAQYQDLEARIVKQQQIFNELRDVLTRLHRIDEVVDGVPLQLVRMAGGGLWVRGVGDDIERAARVSRTSTGRSSNLEVSHGPGGPRDTVALWADHDLAEAAAKRFVATGELPDSPDTFWGRDPEEGR